MRIQKNELLTLPIRNNPARIPLYTTSEQLRKLFERRFCVAITVNRYRRKRMIERDVTGQRQDGRTDFDFYIGKWKVHHRRLRERLKESQEWEEFAGVAVAQKVLDGIGNVDEITMERTSGHVVGMTVRLFDPQSRLWSIYWADSLVGGLQPPMFGEFKDGCGIFYNQETFEGKRIFVRFIWSRLTKNRCQWEQAFSADGGGTWETNWVMEFVRTE